MEHFAERPHLPKEMDGYREPDWNREPECLWDYPPEPSEPVLYEPDYPDLDFPPEAG
jgi:hypothetical protein